MMIRRLTNQLARNREAVESLLSGFYVQALLLLSGVLIARALGPDERGQLALLWVIVLTIVLVGSLGLPQAVTFQIAQGRISIADMRRKIRRPVAIQLAVMLGVAGVITVLSTLSRVPWAPAFLSLVVIPAGLLQGYNLAMLQGASAFRALHVLRTLPTGINTLIVVIVLLLGLDTLFVVTLAAVIGYVVGSAVTWQVTNRHIRTSAGPKADTSPPLREMQRFGLRGFLGSVSPTETFRVDQLVVGLLLSTTDLGLYVAALAFCNLPRFLAQALGLVAFPRIAQDNEAHRRRRLWQFTALGTAAAAAVSLPLALMAGVLVPLAFGEDFRPAVSATQVLLGGTVVLCTRRVMSECMRGAGVPGAGSIAEALSLVALAPALVLLVPPYGLLGVAWALAVSYAVSLFVLLVIAWRHGFGWNPRA